MDYLKKKFSVAVQGEAYAEGWERIFGKKRPNKPMIERIECNHRFAEHEGDKWCIDCGLGVNL